MNFKNILTPNSYAAMHEFCACFSISYDMMDEKVCNFIGFEDISLLVPKVRQIPYKIRDEAIKTLLGRCQKGAFGTV